MGKLKQKKSIPPPPSTGEGARPARPPGAVFVPDTYAPFEIPPRGARRVHAGTVLVGARQTSGPPRVWWKFWNQTVKEEKKVRGPSGGDRLSSESLRNLSSPASPFGDKNGDDEIFFCFPFLFLIVPQHPKNPRLQHCSSRVRCTCPLLGMPETGTAGVGFGRLWEETVAAIHVFRTQYHVGPARIITRDVGRGGTHVQYACSRICVFWMPGSILP